MSASPPSEKRPGPVRVLVVGELPAETRATLEALTQGHDVELLDETQLTEHERTLMLGTCCPPALTQALIKSLESHSLVVCDALVDDDRPAWHSCYGPPRRR